MFASLATPSHTDSFRTLLLIMIVTLLAFTFSTQCLATSDAVPSRTVELRLVDEGQQPVPGALVTAVGLSIGQGPGMSWGTDDGAQPVHRSDDLGRVAMKLPAKWRGGHPVAAIICRISHNNFVSVTTRVAFKDSPATVQLQRGRRIAVTAADGRTGSRIKHSLFAVLSKGPANQEWQLLSNGVLVSGGVAFDRTHLRLIQLPEDGSPRFSRLIDLTEHGRNRRVLLHDIDIHDGVRLEGTVDPRVPRPIHNGIIRVLVSADDNDWQDGCDIREDGTFVIDSLPAGEVIQVTAVCDGWISANPTKEEMAAVEMANQFRRIQPSRLYPQVLRSDEEVVLPMIRMNEAASCRVQILDTSGKPIPNVLVRLQPFQGSYDGRSLFVGQGKSTRSLLLRAQAECQQSATDASAHILPHRVYSASTNADGIAVVTSLPGGPDGSPAMTPVYVSHPDYERPPNDGLGDRGLFRTALYLGQTSEIQFQLRKKQ